jgi:hypothetical protein
VDVRFIAYNKNPDNLGTPTVVLEEALQANPALQMAPDHGPPYCPSVHPSVQAEQLLLELEPTMDSGAIRGQARHATAPATSLYLPSGHGVQVPFTLHVPAAHNTCSTHGRKTPYRLMS